MLSSTYRTVPAWRIWIVRLLGRRMGGDGLVTVYLWRGHYYVDHHSSVWERKP